MMTFGARLTTVLLTAGLVLGSTSAVASAADLTVDSPERVVVNQSYEWVPWRIGGPEVAWFGDAWVELEKSPSRAWVDSDWADGRRSGRFKVYDWNVKPGRHKVWLEDPEDDDWNPMSARPDFITIKFGSRATLATKRLGTRVRLTSRAMRWNATWSEWKPFRATVVRFERRTPRGWKLVGRDRPNKRGFAQVTTRRKAPARYRAVVRGSAGAWKSTSRVKRR